MKLRDDSYHQMDDSCNFDDDMLKIGLYWEEWGHNDDCNDGGDDRMRIGQNWGEWSYMRTIMIIK